ncbi:hypothetical protein GLOIN_2v1471346 [Rhizophagus irregularis DAOM 181602=DAOM 197198]|uniref:Uncharacterized protein n=1 Tax=Rhizophagus irregularis (strain DAOM 181602 / DAOM 197198 / MUCL 43194) TaxID=747089 RepID=A0A2P4QSE2_RHIID|nr:hypothetical protein GLOIN_2v1471346 [Rhizophagus irregularis DAOM 181602=DAOM 197198]POG80573.1 hypothetical protein GLOIN_2v1471346 [Rhizophagus irregularis DAOM 181602=DAOM 197198]|eukprot:XP_025187439.1 hypothetical protein GLOIN_2v1471346 [Rhizophagus irregularis DAOM 181602=DAOM 197198]
MGLVHCLMLHQKPFVIFLGLLSGNNINTPSCIIFFKVLTPEYVHNVVTRIQLVEATLETITPRNRWKFGWFDNDVNIPFKRFFSEVATNFPKEVDPLYESQPLRHTNIRRIQLNDPAYFKTDLEWSLINFLLYRQQCSDFLPSKLAEHDRYARNLTNMINWENEPVNLTGEQGVYFIPRGACYRRCEFNFSTRPNHTRKVHQDISRIRTQMMIVHTNVNVDNRMKTKFINPLLRKISIIRDYIDLVESLELLIDKLDGELKSFVAIIEIVSRWKIINEEKWLESSKNKGACNFDEPEHGVQSCDMCPGKSVFFGVVFQICINKALCASVTRSFYISKNNAFNEISHSSVVDQVKAEFENLKKRPKN